MDWRCEWCGKPHDSDDPPCDNCGHGSFERAVVPVPASGNGDGDEGGLGSKATVWVCTECGREHTKHTPPCSRCGNERLVRERQTIDDAELEAPGYLDLLTPRYAVAALAVVLLGGVFVVGVTGVVDLPGFGPTVPEVSDAPGDPARAGNVSLADAEAAYLDRLNEQRQVAVEQSDTLGAVAEFLNRKRVKRAPISQDERSAVGDALDGACGRSPQSDDPVVDAARFDSAASLAEALLAESRTFPDRGSVGIDIHAGPDGRVYLFRVQC